MWGALPKISSGARAPVEPLVNGAPAYNHAGFGSFCDG